MIRPDLVREGSRVSYADAANPRRVGVVTEVVARGSAVEYRVAWDDGSETSSDLRQHGWNLVADGGLLGADVDVIAVYTREDAVADGVLVDVTGDDTREAGFRCPVALTRALFDLVDPNAYEESWGQSLGGRLWDVLNMARLHRPRARIAAAAPGDAVEWAFPTIFLVKRPDHANNARRHKTFRLKAHLGPADDGRPCLTLSFPHED